MRQYTGGRGGTIGARLIVKDTDTGEPVEGASVTVREGFRDFLSSERTSAAGEIMFTKQYVAENALGSTWPPYLIIEVAKDGYEGLKESVNTEQFLYGYGDKDLYKVLEITIRKGKGTRRVENYKPNPYSGN
jgi:hypothetical protein